MFRLASRGQLSRQFVCKSRFSSFKFILFLKLCFVIIMDSCFYLLDVRIRVQNDWMFKRAHPQSRLLIGINQFFNYFKLFSVVYTFLLGKLWSTFRFGYVTAHAGTPWRQLAPTRLSLWHVSMPKLGLNWKRVAEAAAFHWLKSATCNRSYGISQAPEIFDTHYMVAPR